MLVIGIYDFLIKNLKVLGYVNMEPRNKNRWKHASGGNNWLQVPNTILSRQIWIKELRWNGGGGRMENGHRGGQKPPQLQNAATLAESFSCRLKKMPATKAREVHTLLQQEVRLYTPRVHNSVSLVTENLLRQYVWPPNICFVLLYLRSLSPNEKPSRWR